MNTTPDKREGEDSKVKNKSRRKQYDNSVTMPECAALYLVEYLIEMGMVYGEQSLPLTEIKSWEHHSGIELQPWEVRFVKYLSEAYLNELHAARDPDAEAPWVDAPYVTAKRGMAAVKQQLNYFKSMK